MRKKAVGLLGNTAGERRPIPFVEDTAVPPENLADFIAEFRQVLDEHGLEYGMFGHVDVGVLHVRPALDMKDPEQEPLIRRITDEVVGLTRKYKGLLWGEHGKGVRSEYAPEFFGPLYPSLQRIKAAFDPRNQLNPGKIATPAIDGAELLKIDGVPTRGQQDRQVPPPVREAYDSAMSCNGNGACYNYDPYDAMCPSWKATRQRIHSPKGRASLTREWLRQLAVRGVDPLKESERVRKTPFVASFFPRLKNTLGKRWFGQEDFSHELQTAMAGCLACKSCVSQCPIKVNVPDFRSRFMELYYSRYLRPGKDYLIGALEYLIPYLAKWPAPYNWAMRNPMLRNFLRKRVGMVDSPEICRKSLARQLAQWGVDWATPDTLGKLTPAQRAKSVILVQDAFTSYFESQLVMDIVELLRELDFQVFVAPFRPNGKPLQVHGFLKAFESAARRNTRMLKTLADFEIPFIGVDPSMTLTYRQEYTKLLGEDDVPKVLLIQEWLARQTDHLKAKNLDLPSGDYKLLAHCTEKTSAAGSIRDWQTIFSALGQTLTLESVGCCGMAGTYGHETNNRSTSQQIYQLSWSEVVNNPENAGNLTATGYSCRSQVKRFNSQKIPHPAQILLAKVKSVQR
ncbi:MAG: hypothetical protein KA296_14525, partial [Marinobacter sp.]|nr:hypothetical protein [Marinobacter sp.]